MTDPFLWYNFDKTTPYNLSRRELRQLMITNNIMQTLCVPVFPRQEFKYAVKTFHSYEQAQRESKAMAI